MSTVKKEIIIGIVSLLISAVFQAYFFCSMQQDWIMLVFLVLYAILFLKYFEGDEVVNWVKSSYDRNSLKTMGVVAVLVGIALIPSGSEVLLPRVAEFVISMLSYIFWMLGLLLIDIARKE